MNTLAQTCFVILDYTLMTDSKVKTRTEAIKAMMIMKTSLMMRVMVKRVSMPTTYL